MGVSGERGIIFFTHNERCRDPNAPNLGVSCGPNPNN